jgi:hypothetical protein
MFPQYVKLNVGGSLHYTTIGTLTKHDNMLRAMFSGTKTNPPQVPRVLIQDLTTHPGTGVLNWTRRF